MAVNFSRPGINNGGSDATELFLKVFAGEVLTKFQDEHITKGRVMERTITSGKSAQFPVLGTATASYLPVGAEADGQSIASGEKVITIDGLLVAPVMIYDLDDAMSHFEVRSHYSSEMGRALAEQWDKHVLQQLVLAARTATAAITGHPVGANITEAAANDFKDADKLLAALFKAKQTLLEKNVPEADITAFLPYSAITTLVLGGKVINRDYGMTGSLADGKVTTVAGLDIMPTNRIPSANITTGTAAGTGNKYAGDFTKTFGIVAHKSAVGTVKLLDLSLEHDRIVRAQGDFIIGKYAVGHGVLRPESAVELKLA